MEERDEVERRWREAMTLRGVGGDDTAIGRRIMLGSGGGRMLRGSISYQAEIS